MDKYEILKSISFGERIAEEETELLATYFVETDQWIRLYRGDIDVIYGPKGSGKSALYSLLINKSGELFDRGILLIPGENPRGATVFRDLNTDPPVTEREFINLWKLYITALLHSALVDFGVNTDEVHQLEAALVREGLVKGRRSLGALLQGIREYVKAAFRPKTVEGSVNIDPLTQLPIGFTGKISFSEPSGTSTDGDVRSVDTLLSLADTALGHSRMHVWILLDRLDVAFAENGNLEKNALRALFRAYLDIGGLSNISLKIFLRTDLWAKITDEGFREASHITRHLTLSWNRNSLLNLVVRRSVHNAALQNEYKVPVDLGKQSTNLQEEFFYRLCPAQVDVGPNKPTTFDWLLSRTRDGQGVNAPRELIHLLNSLREVQVKRLEVGDTPPDGEQLFVRPAFKDALPEVSKVRLEQTLYAEYPELKKWIERLRGEKTLQTPETLAEIWGLSKDDAISTANQLALIGFFEKRSTAQKVEYWIPFLYRDSLNLVQGAAEQSETSQLKFE